jgi:hypothetical protein
MLPARVCIRRSLSFAMSRAAASALTSDSAEALAQAVSTAARSTSACSVATTWPRLTRVPRSTRTDSSTPEAEAAISAVWVGSITHPRAAAGAGAGAGAGVAAGGVGRVAPGPRTAPPPDCASAGPQASAASSNGVAAAPA